MTAIRLARPDDIPAITKIYGHYVRETTATFELEAPSEAEMLERFGRITEAGFPYLAATQDGEVIGYACAAPYRVRRAYRFTVEDTIYVAAGVEGQGVGTLLLGELVEQCRAQGFRQMIAVLGDAGEASRRLHAKLGFREAGRLVGVGYKFERWLDTLLMQREL